MNKLWVLVPVALVAGSSVGCRVDDQGLRSDRDSSTADSGRRTDTRGCQNIYIGACWDAPIPRKTGIIPTLGNYAVRSTDPAVSISPLNDLGFVVVKGGSSAGLSVRFTTDGYRYDYLGIKDGAFSQTHGAGADGTYYPSDGYIVSGSFVSPNEAQGYFEYIPSLARITSGYFVAALK